MQVDREMVLGLSIFKVYLAKHVVYFKVYIAKHVVCLSVLLLLPVMHAQNITFTATGVFISRNSRNY